jgi:ferric-dicitrate binding protein FerR (iron transport regulator)
MAERDYAQREREEDAANEAAWERVQDEAADLGGRSQDQLEALDARLAALIQGNEHGREHGHGLGH